MSNRYSNNRRGGNNNRAAPKPQQKFVPKATNPHPTATIPTTTLSNSIRQSISKQSTDDCDPLTTRLRMGDTGDWVSNQIHTGNFVNYLPQDEAVAAGLGADEGGLDPIESQRVVDLLNRELIRLLKLNPRHFWTEVASDTSLHAFLESFLKFRSRWYDFPYRGAKAIVAGVIVGDYELTRRVFMVLYRISSNRDPGARAADSLSPKDHAVILQEKKLLDLPKLLDICAIYGNENDDLTRLLVLNAVNAQPRVHNDLIALVSHFLSIVHTMYQRCSSSLEVLFSSYGGHQDRGSSRLHTDYLEVMDFINDAIVSMDAFIGAYKHAAVFFSCPTELSYGNEELLSTLGKLHDSLIPSLQRGFRIIFAASEDEKFQEMLPNVAISLKMLSTRIAKFGWKLIYFCYLSDDVFDESSPLPAAIKIYPAQVEDPVIRAEILVQTFREISTAGYSNVHEGKSGLTFIQNVEKSHNLMSRIELLRNNGWILMEDDQFQFLNGITMHHPGPNMKETPHKLTVASGKLEGDEDTAITESKISQIKELFPDYGKGFLCACLEVYNQNQEEVIQRILEETLHKDLQSLDRSLENVPPKSTLSVVTRKDKGKGILLEPTTTSATKVGPTVVERQVVGPSLSSSSSSSVGRFVRKSTLNVPDSKTLDCRDEKGLAKTTALISQMEYEDEYDDSFDDLGLSVADSGGFEETETLGDKFGSNRGKSLESDSGNAPSNANKWGSRKKPQFFVKDGKNYSYKVAGSVAAANYNEASLVNQAQKESIHGLGRGGNLPLGAVQRLTESTEQKGGEPDVTEAGGQGHPGNFRGRGRRGGGGGRSNHYRKDQAMKKHFSGLTGH